MTKPTADDLRVATDLVINARNKYGAIWPTDDFINTVASMRASEREKAAKIAESWEHEEKVNPARYIARAIRANKE